jgi:tRNA modification GTPase
MIRRDKTICAPATSSGGALAVIRISGPETFGMLSRIFIPSKEIADNKNPRGFKIIHGDIMESEELIDEVLVSVFRAPHSYTGEDSAEISCHGSPYIVSRILELLVKNDASVANPGEFTQRAFLNGKMDLSQAEAVADLVASETKASHNIAVKQIRGGFSAEISKLRSELLHFASMIELELDFGEEDVEFASRIELISLITKTRKICDRLSDSFRLGNVIRNGISVAIVGKPNSGKSTLLNALLNEERAIVSDIPGTTRDTIEDTINLNGLIYRFIDTAGLRDTSDIIETLGIRKTHEKIMQSSVVLMVDEATESPDDINKRAGLIREMIRETQSVLFIVINKIDLCDKSVINDLMTRVSLENNDILLFISAMNGLGLDTLKENLGGVVAGSRISEEDVIITNLRHYEALQQVSGSLGRVISGLEESIPEDLIAIDIRHAIHYLGEITGEITTDEILGNIFRNFCIGK